MLGATPLNSYSQSLTVTSARPDAGVPGTQVRIYGTGFSPTPSGNAVEFGDSRATVTKASETVLRVTVPEGTLGPTELSVTVDGSTATESKLFVILDEGGGEFSDKRTIDGSSSSVFDSHATDVDGDGDTDVISAKNYSNRDSLVWHQNENRGGEFLTKLIVDNHLQVASYIGSAEITDGKGRDIVVAESRVGSRDGECVLYKNDRQGEEWTKIGIDSGESPGAVKSADMDKDGEEEVLCILRDKVSVSYFDDGELLPEKTNAIENGNYAGYASAETGDLNNDGYLDLVVGDGYGRVIIIENLDGNNFEVKRRFKFEKENVNSLEISDVTGDVYKEIIVGTEDDKKNKNNKKRRRERVLSR
jgi:hypothetical protein